MSMSRSWKWWIFWTMTFRASEYSSNQEVFFLTLSTPLALSHIWRSETSKFRWHIYVFFFIHVLKELWSKNFRMSSMILEWNSCCNFFKIITTVRIILDTVKEGKILKKLDAKTWEKMGGRQRIYAVSICLTGFRVVTPNYMSLCPLGYPFMLT